MPEDLWDGSALALMQKAAPVSAAHYRAEAAQLCELAEQELCDQTRRDWLDLAGKYDELAASVTG
jgi:hypothetical protein